ncbi:MAG: nuclear transport factor 2 family protein [Myxococcales bacterium]|nr:nuclear transport factor 2 family protein [Myxococcales bacterium]
MHPNAELLTRFYAAFAARDHATMGACYADEAHFGDPAFPDLDGAQVRAMWRMLCERGADLKVESSGIEADDTTGKAHWEAWYTFSATGRKVHNVIDATFRFRDGKIVDHADHFDFWRWSRQALGLPGLLLGWSGLLRGKVQKTAGGQLAAFMKNPTRRV